MHLWEFNRYALSYQKKIKIKEKNIIKLAYYTAFFNNSKKSKSLKYYLKEIDDNVEFKPRDKEKLEYARKMYEKINNKN